MISIIIPVLNEEKIIGSLIGELKSRESGFVEEIIVVDGGSTDRTVEEAKKSGVTVIRTEERGRARQMNTGARQAQGAILYFLHADSRPPEQFDRKIKETVVDKGYDAGCFRLQFDDDHPLLTFYAWFTKFDLNLFRFGDQSLFIGKKLFDKIGGYAEELVVMEDNEIVRRIKQLGTFKVLPSSVVTSARKYKDNGVLKLQLIFTVIYVLFYLGFSQEFLVDFYRRSVNSKSETI